MVEKHGIKHSDLKEVIKQLDSVCSSIRKEIEEQVESNRKVAATPTRSRATSPNKSRASLKAAKRKGDICVEEYHSPTKKAKTGSRLGRSQMSDQRVSEPAQSSEAKKPQSSGINEATSHVGTGKAQFPWTATRRSEATPSGSLRAARPSSLHSHAYASSASEAEDIAAAELLNTPRSPSSTVGKQDWLSSDAEQMLTSDFEDEIAGNIDGVDVQLPASPNGKVDPPADVRSEGFQACRHLHNVFSDRLWWNARDEDQEREEAVCERHMKELVRGCGVPEFLERLF